MKSISAISTRADTQRQKGKDMELEHQQQDGGIQLSSLKNRLGENYDFPQTNAADLTRLSDTTLTTDAEALVHNQREDPSLTELWEEAEQPDSNYQVITKNS